MPVGGGPGSREHQLSSTGPIFLDIFGRSKIVPRLHQSLDRLCADRSGTGPRGDGNGEISSSMDCLPTDSVTGPLPFQERVDHLDLRVSLQFRRAKSVGVDTYVRLFRPC
jgi:hypothetical protein